MPKSSPAGKIWSFDILKLLHSRRPIQRALDVGAGLGFYAAYRRPGQHWTGVEIWAPYIKTYDLHSKYDQVVVGDIRYLDWRHFMPLDLVVCGDVLEHMSKDDALKVLNTALGHARIVLVSIPIVISEQGEKYGNPFETHVKSDWTHAECLSSLPDVCLQHEAPPVGVYFLSRNPLDCAVLREAEAELARVAAAGG
jgi:SAM-dependent methyltransferase